MREYGVHLTAQEDLSDLDCIIVAVAHHQFKEMGLAEIKKLFGEGPAEEKVLIDVKGLYDVKELEQSGLIWWRIRIVFLQSRKSRRCSQAAGETGR